VVYLTMKVHIKPCPWCLKIQQIHEKSRKVRKICDGDVFEMRPGLIYHLAVLRPLTKRINLRETNLIITQVLKKFLRLIHLQLIQDSEERITYTNT
jgi:hypothetical protein